MQKIAAADIVIFGGGIAGLWLLHRLRKTGFSAILFESGSLGGGQTHKSQGIIHGGMKYALQGVLTAEAGRLADIPDLWRHCLKGTGEINLSEVPMLSANHYLFSPSKITSKLTGWLASATLSSKVQRLEREAYPTVFQHPTFKGEVYSLDEIVIDVPALIRELVKENQDAVFKIEPLCDEELKFDEEGRLISATAYVAGKSIDIVAQHFIFTAGCGNEVIIKKLKDQSIAMQRRPLHMVLVKTPFHYPLYAHCLGLGTRPRITITTHRRQDNSTIWYLGGQLAEEGVTRSSEAQIKAARDELRTLFPWLNFASAEFATFMIDRAEPQQKSGLMPDNAYFKAVANIGIAWPTKLALAPKLASTIIEHLEKSALIPQLLDLRELRSWPMPPIAAPIWEDMFCKSVA